ncbi:hypothetical protein HYE67_002249 [Fusarium culmorum]|uniref:Protein kinase domain-containing protein n=1 Tax=Fusarium culmorum TaxID=5516 RepID=A0A2T4GSA3_FUSCU|nr:hypothetical protein FCULG_00006460 [Fusarium culmorum]QPC60018.1 hypothetical protein HYE67_002249 [Fusarium culmorum]
MSADSKMHPAIKAMPSISPAVGVEIVVCDTGEEYEPPFSTTSLHLTAKMYTGRFFCGSCNDANVLKRCTGVREKIESLDFSQMSISAIPGKDIPSKLGAIIADILGIRKFDFIAVPDECLYPVFDPSLTRVPSPVPSEYFIKRPCPLEHDGKDTRDAQSVLQEAKVGELLAKNLHPNIAQYRGCEVVDGRIRGLCWDRYAITLHDHVREGKPIDSERILRGVQDALRHIHSLGYCHNDIKDCNVMLDDDGNAVIIDFDSCMPQGEKLLKGGGHPDYSLEGMEFSDPKNDDYSLNYMAQDLLYWTTVNDEGAGDDDGQ